MTGSPGTRDLTGYTPSTEGELTGANRSDRGHDGGSVVPGGREAEADGGGASLPALLLPAHDAALRHRAAQQVSASVTSLPVSAVK